MWKVLLITTTALTTSVMGLLLYLDHKRRTHPNYKHNVIKRRCAEMAKDAVKTYNKVYQLRKHNSFERIFYRELAFAEELALVGDYTNAVHHYLNASDICTDPVQLFMKMKQSLPPDIFNFIVAKLNENVSDTDSSESEEFYETLERSTQFYYAN